jgi:hypothetical protein
MAATFILNHKQPQEPAAATEVESVWAKDVKDASGKPLFTAPAEKPHALTWRRHMKQLLLAVFIITRLATPTFAEVKHRIRVEKPPQVTYECLGNGGIPEDCSAGSCRPQWPVCTADSPNIFKREKLLKK